MSPVSREKKVTLVEVLGHTVLEIGGHFRWPDRDFSGEGCALCYRKTGKTPLEALFVRGAFYHIAPLAADEAMAYGDPGYMGIYPVGVECAKALIADVRAAGVDPNLYFRTRS